jgi:CRP-like cAMP-binding protein
MKNHIEIISGIPLFSGLPKEQLKQVEQIAVERYFGKGDVVFSEGYDGHGFFVVVDGLVKVYKVSAEGKEQILHIFGSGEPFGEVPVFSGQSFPASAEAIAESHLLYFPREAFVDLISGNSSLSLNMLAVLSMRLRQFTVQIENLSLKEVPARLAAYLIYMAEEKGAKETVTLGISKGQLASILGTIPETLSRIFSRMTAQGLIEVNGANIRLLDHSGLKELAERGKHTG